MINGLELVKLYSEIENEDQRLFSEVDESLYEKAFCEGYEYAQREYARANYEGLLPCFQDMLKESRSKIARGLNTSRNIYNKKIKDIAESDFLPITDKLIGIKDHLGSKMARLADSKKNAKNVEKLIREELSSGSYGDAAKLLDFHSRH